MAFEYAKRHQMMYCEVSAASGLNVYEAIQALTWQMYDMNKIRDP